MRPRERWLWFLCVLLILTNLLAAVVAVGNWHVIRQYEHFFQHCDLELSN